MTNLLVESLHKNEGSVRRPDISSNNRSIVDEALNWLGYRAILYRRPEYGQSPVDGFDCSGFVRFVLTRAGLSDIDNFRHANEFFDRFGVLVHWGFHQPGDLVVFSRRGIAPTHIGIVVDRSSYIHSPGKDDKKIELSELVQRPIRSLPPRAIYGTNPIGFKRVAVLDGRWHRL